MSISVPNRTDALRGVLDQAEKYCLRGGVPIEVAADVRLALEEILANLIAHPWPDGGQHEAELHLQVANGELRCEVQDDGVAFDPTVEPRQISNALSNNFLSVVWDCSSFGRSRTASNTLVWAAQIGSNSGRRFDQIQVNRRNRE
jgi:Histidine kinase-like ATPase domain